MRCDDGDNYDWNGRKDPKREAKPGAPKMTYRRHPRIWHGEPGVGASRDKHIQWGLRWRRW